MSMSNLSRHPVSPAKILAFSALLAALAVALGAMTLFRMPQGGSVTPFSMLPVFLAAYYFGVPRGFLVGVVVGLLNLLLSPFIVHPVQLLLDYPLAFGALAAGGFFRKMGEAGMIPGYLTGVFFRYLCAVLSGILFFGSYAPENFNGITWSLWYNLTYLGAEGLMTVLVLLVPSVRRTLSRIGNEVGFQISS